ncbi:unnamed protein product [Closterium sp. Naga37s-1]|nr:unnamed protein product [Closterium sp. Naga37s-1]
MDAIKEVPIVGNEGDNAIAAAGIDLKLEDFVVDMEINGSEAEHDSDAENEDEDGSDEGVSNETEEIVVTLQTQLTEQHILIREQQCRIQNLEADSIKLHALIERLSKEVQLIPKENDTSSFIQDLQTTLQFVQDQLKKQEKHISVLHLSTGRSGVETSISLLLQQSESPTSLTDMLHLLHLLLSPRIPQALPASPPHLPRISPASPPHLPRTPLIFHALPSSSALSPHLPFSFLVSLAPPSPTPPSPPSPLISLRAPLISSRFLAPPTLSSTPLSPSPTLLPPPSHPSSPFPPLPPSPHSPIIFLLSSPTLPPSLLSFFTPLPNPHVLIIPNPPRPPFTFPPLTPHQPHL